MILINTILHTFHAFLISNNLLECLTILMVAFIRMCCIFLLKLFVKCWINLPYKSQSNNKTPLASSVLNYLLAVVQSKRGRTANSVISAIQTFHKRISVWHNNNNINDDSSPYKMEYYVMRLWSSRMLTKSQQGCLREWVQRDPVVL